MNNINLSKITQLMTYSKNILNDNPIINIFNHNNNECHDTLLGRKIMQFTLILLNPCITLKSAIIHRFEDKSNIGFNMRKTAAQGHQLLSGKSELCAEISLLVQQL